MGGTNKQDYTQWSLLESSPLTFNEQNGLRDFCGKNMGSDGELYIFKNVLKLVDKEDIHYGRTKWSDEFSKKTKSKLLKKGYDEVYLYIKNNSKFILKLKQEMDEEIISELLGSVGIGPKLNKTLDSPFTNDSQYIVEEFLSLTAGWNPIYLQQQVIKNHSNKFIKSFGQLMSDMHDLSIIYNDGFWKHIFVNSLTQEIKLIDFGNSYKSNSKQNKFEELCRVYDFLNKLYPNNSDEMISLFDGIYKP